MTRERRVLDAGGRPVLAGRALVLGAVVVLLVVVLASPVHRYLASRAAVGDAAAQLAGDRSELTRLTRQQQLWGDPGYIQQQARTRLQFAMPGDTVYVVVDKGQRSDIGRSAGPHVRSTPDRSWNARLWSSVRAAAL